MFVGVCRVAWILAAIASTFGMEPCKQITNEEKSQLENFVKQWYKLANDQTVTLTDSSTVDSACYRKLVFRVSIPAPPLTLYLAPDGNHLVSVVMDLTVDPAVTYRRNQAKLEAQL